MAGTQDLTKSDDESDSSSEDEVDEDLFLENLEKLAASGELDTIEGGQQAYLNTFGDELLSLLISPLYLSSSDRFSGCSLLPSLPFVARSFPAPSSLLSAAVRSAGALPAYVGAHSRSAASAGGLPAYARAPLPPPAPIHIFGSPTLPPPPTTMPPPS